MRKTAAFGALVLLFLAIPSSSDERKSFRELQLKFPRVRTAAKEKNEVLEKWFREKGVAFPPRAILFRAFKKEALLELWARMRSIFFSSTTIPPSGTACSSASPMIPGQKTSSQSLSDSRLNTI